MVGDELFLHTVVVPEIVAVGNKLTVINTELEVASEHTPLLTTALK